MLSNEMLSIVIAGDLILGREEYSSIVAATAAEVTIQDTDRLIASKTRRGPKTKSKTHERTNCRTLSIGSFLALLRDTDTVRSVSYTHLTLPTIYSV